jgi:hypothetical protein
MYARDGVSIPVDVFHEHQEAEIAHAQKVAATLGLPLSTFQAFDTSGKENSLSMWKSAS